MRRQFDGGGSVRLLGGEEAEIGRGCGSGPARQRPVEEEVLRGEAVAAESLPASTSWPVVENFPYLLNQFPCVHVSIGADQRKEPILASDHVRFEDAPRVFF